MKIKFDKRRVCILITLVSCVLLIACEAIGMGRILGEGADKELVESLNVSVSRALGSVVFLTILVYLGYKVLNPIRKPFFRSLLFCLPAFCVVINNLPIYPLATGMVSVTDPWWRVLVLAIECFMVGLLEETCFRGMVLLGFLRKRRGTVLGRFISIILSSAVFGVVHLINIFLGASPTAVLMQIGYSFLIGAMCSVVLMKTANIWLCVLLHAIFNFCGALVTFWEPVTITVTVLISVAVTAYMLVMFFKIKTDELDRIYQ